MYESNWIDKAWMDMNSKEPADWKSLLHVLKVVGVMSAFLVGLGFACKMYEDFQKTHPKKAIGNNQLSDTLEIKKDTLQQYANKQNQKKQIKRANVVNQK